MTHSFITMTGHLDTLHTVDADRIVCPTEYTQIDLWERENDKMYVLSKSKCGTMYMLWATRDDLAIYFTPSDVTKLREDDNCELACMFDEQYGDLHDDVLRSLDRQQ